MHQNVTDLIELAEATFGRGVPEDAPLQELRRRIDSIRAEDFDLGSKMASLSTRDRWFSIELHRHPDFDLGLFVIPRGHSIPFHGHPLMTVLMKILWGSVQIKAYDWAEEYPWTGLARCTYDKQVNGADESLLILPKQGNVHRLQAIDDCVFLDLLAPPYAEPEGRPCHNYREEKEFTVHGQTLMRLVRE